MTPSEAYRFLLKRVLAEETTVSPRGMAIKEILNCCVMISNPSDDPIVTKDEKRNKKIATYTRKEFDLYARGVDDVEEFSKFAPFWKSVADPGGKINSAYGKLVWYDRNETSGKTPWEWAKESILRDPHTRQAVIQFIRPDHFKWDTKDLVCTNHGIFHVRDCMLHFTVVMRSNDAVRGFVYDAPWFMHLQLKMLGELAELGFDLDPGMYTHLAHSMHIYERDIEVAERMVGRVDDKDRRVDEAE